MGKVAKLEKGPKAAAKLAKKNGYYPITPESLKTIQASFQQFAAAKTGYDAVLKLTRDALGAPAEYQPVKIGENSWAFAPPQKASATPPKQEGGVVEAAKEVTAEASPKRKRAAATT